MESARHESKLDDCKGEIAKRESKALTFSKIFQRAFVITIVSFLVSRSKLVHPNNNVMCHCVLLLLLFGVLWNVLGFSSCFCCGFFSLLLLSSLLSDKIILFALASSWKNVHNLRFPSPFFPLWKVLLLHLDCVKSGFLMPRSKFKRPTT